MNNERHPTVGPAFYTQTAAERYFEAAFKEWITRKMNPDFHIDYLAERVKNGELTGLNFGAQVKGTRPHEPFKKDPTFKIKGKHIRYYLEKSQFPVFLILVDVINSVVCWVFLQEYAIKNLSAAQLKQKSITIRLPLQNTLNDLNAFERAVEAASEFMRELRPSTIHAAVVAKENALNQRDPRLKFRIDVKDGIENINITGNETVPLTFKFKPQNPSTALLSFKNFFEKGKPLDIEVDSLTILGSKALEDEAKSAKIQVSPRQIACEIQFFSETDNAALVAQMTGTVSVGSLSFSLHFTVKNAPLSLDRSNGASG